MSSPAMPAATTPYAARLEIDYPERLDRFTTVFRLIFILPIVIILSLVSVTDDGAAMGGSVLGGLSVAIALMIVVRRIYPGWWFDFARELTRFGARVGAYIALLTDRFPRPSTSNRSIWRSTIPMWSET